jgi:very-short-patch-repair endonuclease
MQKTVDINATSHRKYETQIKQFAKANRKNATDAEKKLWYELRSRLFINYKFRRQYAIENKYIADFVCIKEKLIIELDGGQHGETQNEILDEQRTEFLKSHGFKVIRLWNNEILTDIETCKTVIFEQLEMNK